MRQYKPRDPAKTCTGTKKNGAPCTSYRIKSSSFCVMHDPVKSEEMKTLLREVAQEGGRKGKESQERRKKVREALRVKSDPSFIDTVPVIETPEDIRRYAAEILPMILTGYIPPQRASVWSKTLQVVARTFSDNDNYAAFMQSPMEGEDEPIETYSPLGTGMSLSSEDQGELKDLLGGGIPDFPPMDDGDDT